MMGSSLDLAYRDITMQGMRYDLDVEEEPDYMGFQLS